MRSMSMTLALLLFLGWDFKIGVFSVDTVLVLSSLTSTTMSVPSSPLSLIFSMSGSSARGGVDAGSSADGPQPINCVQDGRQTRDSATNSERTRRRARTHGLLPYTPLVHRKALSGR